MRAYTSGPEVSHNVINPLTSDGAKDDRRTYTGRPGKSSGTGFVDAHRSGSRSTTS